MEKRLLTIQDVSCLGQCSLTVALPIISACGIETAILPSAVLSTHTGGFKNYTFCDLTGEMPKIEQSWIKDNLKFDAFYTGYVCQNQIDPILSIAETCGNPGAIRVVDPVMADNGKMYPGFNDDFPQHMKRLCKNADYILPNLTEAAFLLNQTPVLESYDQAFIEKMCFDLIKETGAKNVVLTGVSFAADKLGFALCDGKTVEYYFNDKLEKLVHGTGDVYASVFSGALVRGKSAYEAAALAADIVCESIKATPAEHWYGVYFEKALPKLIEKLN